MTTAQTPAVTTKHATNDGIVGSQIKRFAAAHKATEKRYAELLAFNAGMKKKGVKFRTEAIRAQFQNKLNAGRDAANTGRKIRAALVKAMKTVGANPKEYGLGEPVTMLVIGTVLVAAVLVAISKLEGFVNGMKLPVQSDFVGPDATPEEKLRAQEVINEAAEAKADLEKSTLDRVMDNLPLIGGLGLAALFLPKLMGRRA